MEGRRRTACESEMSAVRATWVAHDVEGFRTLNRYRAATYSEKQTPRLDASSIQHLSRPSR